MTGAFLYKAPVFCLCVLLFRKLMTNYIYQMLFYLARSMELLMD